MEERVDSESLKPPQTEEESVEGIEADDLSLKPPQTEEMSLKPPQS